MSAPVVRDAPIVGVDAGGTWLRVAVTSGDPTAPLVVHRTPAPATLDELVAGVRGAVADVVGGRREHRSGTRIGVAVAGLVHGTTCRWVPNLPFLDGADLAALLGADVVVAGNDAQLSLLAERTHGAAADVHDAVLLAIGTGIGSAVLADGRIVRGAGGAACSFGWATLDPDGPGSETTGWLEGAAAGRALDALAVETGAGSSGGELIAAARRREAGALAAVERVAGLLAAALAGAVGLLAPERVLITGGVAAAADQLLPHLVPALHRQLPPHLRSVQVIPGRLGADAALIGALVAADAGATWWEAR